MAPEVDVEQVSVEVVGAPRVDHCSDARVVFCCVTDAAAEVRDFGGQTFLRAAYGGARDDPPWGCLPADLQLCVRMRPASSEVGAVVTQFVSQTPRRRLR